nr:MAG TPA: hypothetical protein [Caudoviricetes sp.]
MKQRSSCRHQLCESFCLFRNLILFAFINVLLDVFCQCVN